MAHQRWDNCCLQSWHQKRKPHLAGAHDRHGRLKGRHLARQRVQEEQSQMAAWRQRRLSSCLWLEWRDLERNQVSRPAHSMLPLLSL